MKKEIFKKQMDYTKACKVYFNLEDSLSSIEYAIINNKKTIKALEDNKKSLEEFLNEFHEILNKTSTMEKNSYPPILEFKITIIDKKK